MLYKLLWHGLGIFCTLSIMVCGWKIAKRRHTVTLPILVGSCLLGLFLGVLGVAVFSLIFIFVSDQVAWFMDIPFFAMMYILAFCYSGTSFIFGKAGAHFLGNRFSGESIVYSALIGALLLILQPIAYGWLKILGRLLGIV
ncbi:MAG: hypothetical protein DELT_01755 [Desulfovibrio sp.]